MMKRSAHPGWQSETHGRPFLVLLPICLAVVLSLIWLVPRFAAVLKENLQSNPDGWRGVMPLAVVMSLTSFLLILICAFIAAVVGYLLQILVANRQGVRLRKVT